MKHSMKTMALVGLLATGVAVSAHAGVGDNIENWRAIEGVSRASEKIAANETLSFPNQPNEIWNWRQKEGVGQQESVYQQHMHSGKRNSNVK